MNFLKAALEYHARGLSVIPIRHRKGTSGKQPAIARWKPFARYLPEQAKLEEWFSRDDLDGVAVITGAVSDGLTVRDFDDASAFHRWAEEWEVVAKTLPTVQTARGYHVWFRSVLRSMSKSDDGELRAGEVYVLAPPSRHPSGHEYRWVIPLPPSGERLTFIDPRECGLAECWLTMKASPVGSPALGSIEQRDRETEITEETDCIPYLCDSVVSVNDVPSIRTELDPVVTAAIQATLPEQEGQRNRRLFDLAQAIKGIPHLAEASVGDVRAIAEEWHRRALPFIRTKPFDETWAEFTVAWSNVKWPKGTNPVRPALAKADTQDSPAWSARYDCPATLRLIRWCRELQRGAGSSAFFLDCRTVGESLGLDHVSAWKRLRMLEADGVLKCDKRGNAKRATRYRYVAND